MNWELGKATDYFDNREKISISEYAEEYGRLSIEEQRVIDLMIKERITGWLEQVDDINTELITNIGAIIVDDIYKAGNLMYSYSDCVSDYLRITAKTVMDWYTSKGITIHYMTNNTFTDYLRPLRVFPMMLEKSNIIYVCPQHIAWKSMEKAGVPMEQFRLFYRDYKEEAYEYSQDLIKRCCECGAHYIHLDIDAGKEAFEYTLSFINTPGHIVAFREESPQDSSKFLLLS